MTIYLYVKTHNITGLKYLGSTSQDPHKYKGSGIYWNLHIKKHGNDVNTKILGIYETNKELKPIGIYYSKLWNIVESEEWANLTEEAGYGGVPGYKKSTEHIEKIRQANLNRKKIYDFSKMTDIQISRIKIKQPGYKHIRPVYLGY